MNILFDLIATQGSGNTVFHGGGKYAKVVFYELLKTTHSHSIAGVFIRNRELDTAIINFCKEKNIKLIPVNHITEIPKLIQTEKINRFYSALATNYSELEFINCEFFFTIHGLRSIETATDKYEIKYLNGLRNYLVYFYKNLFPSHHLKVIKKKYAKQFKTYSTIKFIAISNHTKYSLISAFPFINEFPIEVCYSPSLEVLKKDTNAINEEKILNEFKIEKKNYFLLVSGNIWLKNNYRAIMALDQIYSQFKSITQKTILLGVNDKNIYRKIKNKEKFIFEGYVSEEKLEILLKNCYAFIYPSLNEGFGYPPVEAMKHGIPIIAACDTSISEVCGDAVLYFNPYSIEELKARILQITFNDTASLRDKSLLRYGQITDKQKKDLQKLVQFILD